MTQTAGSGPSTQDRLCNSSNPPSTMHAPLTSSQPTVREKLLLPRRSSTTHGMIDAARPRASQVLIRSRVGVKLPGVVTTGWIEAGYVLLRHEHAHTHTSMLHGFPVFSTRIDSIRQYLIMEYSAQDHSYLYVPTIRNPKAESCTFNSTWLIP